MLVQDNLQVTNINSWICAILEGEGDFKNKDGNLRVRISNTDLGIIRACEKYLEDNYVYYVTYKEKKRGYDKISNRINISSLKNDILNFPLTFFNLIEPYLECRRNEFEQIFGTSTTTRPLSIDRSWLTGIWEAEGTLSLIFRTYKGRIRTNFAISIGNTNKKIIDKVHLNLNKMWCGHHISYSEATENRKESWRIEICGMQRCHTFLLGMKNYWVSPRNQKRASLMLEFIESRLEVRPTFPYSPRECQIVQAMRDLNR